MSRIYFLLFFLCQLGGLSFVACTSTSPTLPRRIADNDTSSLRIACMPTMGCLPFYYAVESGLCDSLNLPLYIRTFSSQFDADTALMSKHFDGGITNALRLKQYQSKGKMQGCSLFIRTEEKWEILTNASLRIRKIESLRGRTLAADRFSISDAIVHRLRDSLRWKIDDLHLPQINNIVLRSRMLDNVQVDAAVLPEPWATWARQQGHRPLFTTDDRLYDAGLYVLPKSLRHARRKKQLEQLKIVYNLAVTELNQQPSSALDSVLVKRYQFPREVIKNIRLPHFSPI